MVEEPLPDKCLEYLLFLAEKVGTELYELHGHGRVSKFTSRFVFPIDLCDPDIHRECEARSLALVGRRGDTVALTEKGVRAVTKARWRWEERWADLARAVRDGKTSSRTGKPAIPPVLRRDSGATEDSAERYVFVRDGEGWQTTYKGRTFRVKHSVGMWYVSELLRLPQQSIPCLVLSTARPDRQAGPRESTEGLLGKVLDEGLTIGLDREDGERARKAVCKAINTALANIRKENPDLYRHLDANIRLGYSVSYVGDVKWQL